MNVSSRLKLLTIISTLLISACGHKMNQSKSTGLLETNSNLLGAETDFLGGIDTSLFAKSFTSTELVEDEEGLITLEYNPATENRPTSCQVQNIGNLNVTQACLCTEGVCQVGLSAPTDFNGEVEFEFKLLNSDEETEWTTATLDIADDGLGTEAVGDNWFQLGHSVAFIGDVNGDGKADYLASAPTEDYYYTGGTVSVLSGADGSLIYKLLGEGEAANPGMGSFDNFGLAALSIHDYDLDGVDDFLIGAPGYHWNHGRVYLYSGVDGDLILTRNGDNISDKLGYVLNDVGDLNSDGINDIAASALNWGAGDFIRIFSGADFSILGNIAGHEDDRGFGIDFNGIDDVNGDGFRDIVVGTMRVNDVSESGKVQIFSGLDFSEIISKRGEHSWDMFGRWVGVVEDQNGDGIQDIFVAAPGFGIDDVWYGKVQLLSGSDLTLIRSTLGQDDYHYLGLNMKILPDQNGDGVEDLLLVGMPSESGWPDYEGKLVVLSGADFTKLTEVDKTFSSGETLFSVDYIENPDGNGLDLVVGASWFRTETASQAGKIHQFNLNF